MPIFILFFIIQLGLIVHVFKTGRNTTWVFLLLLFPLVGGLAYVIIELLPEWLGSTTGRSVKRSISHTINPDKDLKTAYRNVEIADTVENLTAFAEQCLIKERYQEAKEVYERCLSGIYADDPQLMLGLAKAYYGLADYAKTISLLDELIEKNPDFKSPDGHLLYACAQEQAGNTAAAIREYETLVKYYSGPEPACRLALLLKKQGDTQQSKQLFTNIVEKSRIAGRHYNSLYKEWVTIAKREMQG